MHSQRGYKICVGHPGATKVFSKLRGIQYYFPENIRCNTYYEGENFSEQIPLSIAFLNPKISSFFFPKKNNLICGVKCEKLNFRKSEGIY